MSNWENKKLGSICDFQNGFAFKSKTFKKEGTPVVRITNIRKNIIDLSDTVYIDEKDYQKDLSNFTVNNGDLLIAMSGATTGKIGIHIGKEKLLLNQRVGKFLPHKDLLRDYLFYFLLTKIEENLAISAGSAQPNLSTEQIKNFPIPLPPLSEQQHIVDILDKAFDAIDQAISNTEKNLQNAKDLFQSKLDEAFSIKQNEKLGNICKIIGGGTPSKKNKSYYNGNIPWATVRDMQDDLLTDTKIKITELGLKNSSSNIISKNHVIIATRVGLGKVCLIMQDTAINQDLKGIIPVNSNEIMNEYLFWWFKSISKEIINAGTGATVQGVKIPFIRNLDFPKIPLKEQEIIVINLNTINSLIDDIKDKYLCKLSKLIKIKKSLLQKAFSGELTN